MQKHLNNPQGTLMKPLQSPSRIQPPFKLKGPLWIPHKERPGVACKLASLSALRARVRRRWASALEPPLQLGVPFRDL